MLCLSQLTLFDTMMSILLNLVYIVCTTVEKNIINAITGIRTVINDTCVSMYTISQKINDIYSVKSLEN